MQSPSSGRLAPVVRGLPTRKSLREALPGREPTSGIMVGQRQLIVEGGSLKAGLRSHPSLISPGPTRASSAMCGHQGCCQRHNASRSGRGMERLRTTLITLVIAITGTLILLVGRFYVHQIDREKIVRVMDRMRLSLVGPVRLRSGVWQLRLCNC